MKIIKITGGIGAGKSLAGEILKKLGEVVIDADDVARKFRQAQHLSPAAIFGDPTVLRQIENKTHPLIVADIEKQMEEHKKDGRKRVFVLVPALKYFAADIKSDYAIAVVADEEARIKRVTAQRGLTEEEVKLRIINQATDAEISKAADAVIENNGTQEEFINKLKTCLVPLL